MPFTVSHLGPGFFLNAIGNKFVNFWALILGSIFVDIEALILVLSNYFIGCASCVNHGFFHSIFGALIGSFLLAVLLWIFRKVLEKISLKFTIKQSFSFPVLFLSSFIGWLMHILIDSFTHYDVYLFWPLKSRLIYFGPQIYWKLGWILFFIGIISIIWLYRAYKKKIC